MNQPSKLPEHDYEVKSWPSFFSAMVSGKKLHDMRDKRDRQYKVGDRMKLREYDPFNGVYTGREAVFEITYITSNDTPCAMSSAALDKNFCILSVKLLGRTQDEVRITVFDTSDNAAAGKKAMDNIRRCLAQAQDAKKHDAALWHAHH